MQHADINSQDFIRQRRARVVYPDQLNMLLDWEQNYISNFVQNKEYALCIKSKTFFQTAKWNIQA